MLEFILDRHVIYVLMGMSAIAGVVAKVVVGGTLRKLVAAAESMGKSNHPLMRLVRAKFEHTCMISEKVENVGVFVDKYLYEYRVAGVRFHAWRRLEMAGAGVCLVLGGVGAAISYRIKESTEQAAMIGGTGVAMALVVFLVHMLTDEEYRLDAVRNYMVDYLENIYQHRYEKAYKKEVVSDNDDRSEKNYVVQDKEDMLDKTYAAQEKDDTPGRNPAIPESDSLIWAMYKTEPLQVEDERKATASASVNATDKSTGRKKERTEIPAKEKSAEKKPETAEQKAQDEAGRNQRIREILEEFMA